MANVIWISADCEAEVDSLSRGGRAGAMTMETRVAFPERSALSLVLIFVLLNRESEVVRGGGHSPPTRAEVQVTVRG